VTAGATLAQTVIPEFGKGSSCVRDNGAFCWDWVQQNWGNTLSPRLWEHLQITALAVGIGFAIAFGAALLAYRHRSFEAPFANVAGLLFTVPSIAAFQLLVPITGLTRTTILIPLVAYSLLIMFRNTLTGLRDVPEEVRDAARGMGLTDRQLLWRVELPVAVPAIVAGLRSATVTTIGLATIAALVIDQGLGAPIFEAIPTSFNTELIAAGGLAIALAVVADVALLVVQRRLTPWARRTRTAS
jgi:osmoprotectant transport system permease protein